MIVTAIINGRTSGADDGTVSVFDRGFLYGDSVFEVFRTYGGETPTAEAHLARLAASAELVRMAAPEPELLRREVAQAIAEARRDGDEGDLMVRVIVTRGGGMALAFDDEGRLGTRVIMALPLRAHSRELYRSGVGVMLASAARTTDGTDAMGAKVSNYLRALLLLDDAKRRGAHEVLLVDERGAVREGATSNVFAWHGDRLLTPPAGDILVGITRGHVLAAARDLGVAVSEERLTREALASAREVFITSSLREVMPIVSVDGRRVGDGAPGAMTRRLHGDLRRRIAPKHTAAMPWE
ncbi:MAG: aminotransferase class IV [Myxococcales bacterium]|nr:aminotransferase class IV [Myxococcales bacterium]